MKQYIKKTLSKLFVIGALAITSFNAQAVVQVFTVPAGWVSATNLFQLSAKINTVTISIAAPGTGATNLNYALTDQPAFTPANGWGPLKQTNGTYTNIISFTTNITRITTNFSGVFYTNVISNAVYTVAVSQGPISNDWRRLTSSPATLGSNSAVTITGPFSVVYGLGITNMNAGVPIVITVDYDPAL